MSTQYEWSTNPQKLARAIGNAGPNASEEAIKAEYVKIGGKIALSESDKNTMENTEEVVIETPEAKNTFNEASGETASAPEVESEVTSSETVETGETTGTDA